MKVTITPDHPLVMQKQEEALRLSEGTVIKPHGPLSNPCSGGIPNDIRFVPLRGTFLGSQQGDTYVLEEITDITGIVAGTCPSCHESFSFSAEEQHWYPV